ncbi:hypothetical protein [Algoriphagus taiwanensis]|uniref:Beta-lactamase-inhibitor-like, PepSY-like n=1 Tax=Algoriphagus taiwanensis TaxID=1445656 RepID=A0ABQ6PXZ7_9BACT|nr:hypothetical protein Ataiwa_07780 [Algoriphagus taiwanensis]
MLRYILFSLVLCLGLALTSRAQDKTEREVGVKPSEVPDPAKSWLKDAFEKVKRPKWFLEYSQDGQAFEAKFWWEKHYHSVKFDSLGKLMDVEIEISKDEMPPTSWEEIQGYFQSEFEEFSVMKIQRQLIGDESDLEDFFDEEETEGVTIRYEIVFQGKKGAWQIWEGLFDEQGAFISIVRVQMRSVDNLIF